MKKMFGPAAGGLFCLLILLGCQEKSRPVGPVSSTIVHLGLVTGSQSKTPDEYLGALKLIKEYGLVKDGGLIQHVTYPDGFTSDMEKNITAITDLAEEPYIRAIVVNPALPGTTEAFRRIKAKHQNLLLLAGEPQEDPLAIESTADLAINADYVARGYLMLWSAKQMGAKTFVHLSFPRHLAQESISRQRAIFEVAAKDLGLTFLQETMPDPASDASATERYLTDKLPGWLQKYGKDTAFFATNDAQNTVLLKLLIPAGAYFIEAGLPAPDFGYPLALNLDLSASQGDYPAMIQKIEAALSAKSLNGRFGTWAWSYGYAASAGLAELAKRVIDGKAVLSNPKDLTDALAKYSGGAHWNGYTFTDPATRAVAKNHILVYQDTFALGKGPLGATEQAVPDKYFTIR